MKKILAVTLIAALFASTAFATPDVFKKHSGKKGKDDTAVNCAYCHTTAGVKKEKGQDHAALQAGAYCALSGCHKK